MAAVNAGTKRLKQEYAFEPPYVAVRKKALAKARDPIVDQGSVSVEGDAWRVELKQQSALPGLSVTNA